METKRAVEILARPVADGDPYYGSGYCLGGGLILTCGHVIPLDTAGYRLTVRADLGRHETSASVAWRNSDHDVALLRLDEANALPTDPVPLVNLLLTAESGTLPFEMFGWPRSGNMPGTLKTTRDPVHARGVIESAEFLGAPSGLLRLRSGEHYPELPEGSYWAGMSGAAIFIEEHLVAVQVSQPNSRLTSYLAGRPVSMEVLSVLDESGRSGIEVLADAGNMSAKAFTPESQRGIDWPIMVGRLPQGADCFQKRPEQTALFMAFQDADTNTVVVTQVLTGMGGVGKTQLAANFARTQWGKRNVDLLVWVDATSRLSIISTYAAAADRIGVTPVGGASDLNKSADRFWSWLAEKSDKKWLIVLDDVADPDDLEGLRPPLSSWGNTVVTTRRNDPSHYAEGWTLLKVGLFTADQARQYLRSRLSDHPDALIGADKLAQDLGYLPLALASASAYIRYIADSDGTADGPSTCAGYSALLADQQRRLDEESMPTKRIHGYGRTLAATWSISIDQVDRQLPSGIAHRLMELLSLLDPNGIPFAILGTGEIRAYLGSQSPEEIRTALRALRDFSLIEFADADDDPIRIHALVQRAVRDTTEASAEEGTRALADSLSSLWPARQHDTDFVRLLQNNTLVLSAVSPEPLRTPALHELLFQLGDSYGLAGLVVQAHEYFTALREQATGPRGADSRDMLKARQRDAYWLGYRGKAEDAFREFEALAADQARVLGPDDPDTLITRHNVARFRGRSGDAPGAVSDLVRLVADETRVLGATHLETLKSRNILGYWHNMTGDHDGAVAELEAVLPIWTEHYGPDHAETLRARIDLAMAKADKGDYAGAIVEGETLVQDRTRALGPDKPETLSSRASVAHWRAMAGEDSVAALEAIASDHVRVLGPRQPNTLRAQAYHIEAIASAGDVPRAIAMMTNHLEVVLEVHGPTHILTQRCQQKLAEWQGAS
jgi:NB-ARC domain/Tetratricopeptide repeat/Trypsin-like peptidase domain